MVIHLNSNTFLFILQFYQQPGFIPIPIDAHPLPDQSSRNDDKNKQQHELISMRKRSTFNNQSSRIKEQMDSDPNKHKRSEHNQNASVAVCIQESNMIHNQMDQDQEKVETKTPKKSMKDIELECEPSIQTDNENDVQIKSIPGSKQSSAEKDQQQFEFFSPKDKHEEGDDQVVKIETALETNNDNKENNQQFEMNVKQRSTSKNETTTIDGSTKSTTKTNEHITTNNFNNILTQNNAIHCIFTNENNSNNLNNIILTSKISEFQQGNKLDDSKLNYSVLDYPQTAIDVNAKILNYQDIRNSYNQKLYSFNKRNDHSQIPIPLTSPLNDDANEIRLEINLNDHINFFNERRQSKIHKQSVDINIMSEIHDPNGEAQIVEIRHCLDCNIEQKIRAKHCKICKRCVATYDHHCPWIGNCVGEKNRCHFWWFLLFQFSEVIFAMVLVINSIIANQIPSILMFVIDIVLLGFFLVMVGSLLIYHTYLATENLTTSKYNQYFFQIKGESARWEKISYLKEWPEQLGSPFNRGMWQNIKQYCQCIKESKYLQSWYIPKLRNQAESNQKGNQIMHQQP